MAILNRLSIDRLNIDRLNVDRLEIKRLEGDAKGIIVMLEGREEFVMRQQRLVVCGRHGFI
jgi:hypothetical protein